MTTNNNDSGKRTYSPRFNIVIDLDADEALTDSGQPLALEERLDTGSKSWSDVQKDKHVYSHQSSFPSCSSARTTLYAREADDEERFDVMFSLQHGRQHPFERRANGYSEGWGGQKVRLEDVDKYNMANITLSRADVKAPVRQYAVQKVMRENLTGFSRYYEGVQGAALGFATLCKYDDVEMAKDSYLVEEAEEMLDVNGERLVEYVWRKYGDDVQ